MSDRIEIVKELRALEKFCNFPPDMSGADRERFLKDYLADIEKFPLDAIRKACQRWRQMGQTKFPVPGQLIGLIRLFVPVETQDGGKPEPWRPLSDAEFAGLSLRGKIEHHRILAHEARRKAGPMWKDGRPAAPEDLPERWHEWTKRAEWHEQEGERLSKHLRPAPTSMAAE